jgi:2-haloacid dehalogenase
MTLPKYLTFDCYGTLIDFDLDSVTLRALGPRADQIDTDAFLQAFEEIRFQEVLDLYRPYRDVLRESLALAMQRFGLSYRDEDGEAIIEAVPEFGPFPDVPAALERVGRRCKLVIISNTEDDLIQGNVRKIGVPFERVITAEQARAYKPSLAAFRYMFDQLGTDGSDVLHVAQGFSYDIVPAHQLGLARVWINRSSQPGDAAYGPYQELPDLSGLPDLLGV